MHAVLALILCLALALPVHAATLPQFTGSAITATDGDTITVLTQDKQTVKIRLYGINCPERGRKFWPRAKQATADAVLGKTVTVQPVDTVRDGRIVAVVLMPGGKSLNEHLVREGLASVDPQYCTREDICAPLKKLENAAKRQNRGMWEDKTPVAPKGWTILPGGGGPSVPGSAPK